MEFKIDFKAESIDGVVSGSIGELEQRLNAYADRVVYNAQQNLAARGRIRSGNLYNSIRKSRIYSDGERIMVDITANTDYASIIEDRDPYLLPALQSAGSL